MDKVEENGRFICDGKNYNMFEEDLTNLILFLFYSWYLLYVSSSSPSTFGWWRRTFIVEIWDLILLKEISLM